MRFDLFLMSAKSFGKPRLHFLQTGNCEEAMKGAFLEKEEDVILENSPLVDMGVKSKEGDGTWNSRSGKQKFLSRSFNFNNYRITLYSSEEG